jgi:L-amino acid N-acyltransferase YncA
VASAWRRHGLGRALSERTFVLARERGFTKVLTDVRADNVDSLAFHLALGFSVVGTARDQAVMGGRAYDVVFIERGL